MSDKNGPNGSASNLNLLYQGSPVDSNISNATDLSVGSITNYSNCPPGLEYLHCTNALYLKPYSGPHVLGNFTSTKQLEILNAEGKRIFMLSIDPAVRRSHLMLIRDDEDYSKKKYPVQMSVHNHLEDVVFHYYGTPGKIIKVGSDGSCIWGEVSRNWDTICGCACPNPNNKVIHFDAYVHNNDGKKDKNVKRDSDARRLSVEVSAGYSIHGKRKFSFFPSNSTKKLYFGTYECKIRTLFVEGDTVKETPSSIGKVSTNLKFQKSTTELPGIVFPLDLDVHHKAVLFGTLLVDIIRN